MRVLVAGRHAKVLAVTASTFATDVKFETATTRAESLALLNRFGFDLVIACERLGDGSGLEVLSQVAVNSPNSLRMFAARPKTLQLLKGELGMFGLFRTLPYPIDFRRLWAALSLARSCCLENQTRTPPARRPGDGGRHVMLESSWLPGAARTAPAQPSRHPAPPRVPSTPPRVAAPQSPARIPESAAFKAARAKRNAARTQAPATKSESRREPALTTLSLSELAQLTVTPRPLYESRTPAGRNSASGRRKAALFVGSGVFAAVTAAVLSYFMLSSNNSLAHAPTPLITSIERPESQPTTAWQQPSQEPQPQPGLVRGEITAPSAADLEVQAEAAPDASEIEPGHPGPPPPNPPPGPSEPPAVDWTGQVPEE